MNAHTRTFEAKPALRESVPLLIGLMGPSGSGKTYSALRLATGIQQVSGGDIFGIDTEARRMLHYSDIFKFKHVQFDAPFGSLDYLEALKYCVGQGAKIIVVDSMSHEHEGPGGLLDAHDKELDRIAGDDWGKRERAKMLAWQKPKANRRRLINGLLQLNCSVISCFRAKETVKPVKVNGKTEIVPQGFMPIAGEEFLFEQTVNCLLLPKSGGVPTWRSDNVGEKLMMKLPAQFETIFADNRPLDEQTGKQLAEWARGGTAGTNAAAQARPAGTSQPSSSAATRSWDKYVADWNAIMNNTEATGDQIKAAWSEQTAERERINWPEGERESLAARVKTAIQNAG